MKWTGVLTYFNGNKYVGEFKDGIKNGQGTLIYYNGDEYVGEFKNDYFDGQGKYTRSNGTVIDGEWEENRFVEKSSSAEAEEIFDETSTIVVDFKDDIISFNNGESIHAVGGIITALYVYFIVVFLNNIKLGQEIVEVYKKNLTKYASEEEINLIVEKIATYYQMITDQVQETINVGNDSYDAVSETIAITIIELLNVKNTQNIKSRIEDYICHIYSSLIPRRK